MGKLISNKIQEPHSIVHLNKNFYCTLTIIDNPFSETGNTNNDRLHFTKNTSADLFGLFVR